MKAILMTLAFSVLLSACAGGEPVPADRFYQLAPLAPQSRHATPALNGGLEIDYTQADPLRSGRAVLYSEADRPLQLNRYHYAFWVDQPPRMVQRAIVSYLRELNVADRVFTAGQRGQAVYRLETRLLKFEQLRQGGEVTVEVALQATLKALPEGSPLWTRTYTQTRAGGDMHATADAIQRALGGVLQRLGEDLVGIPATQP